MLKRYDDGNRSRNSIRSQRKKRTKQYTFPQERLTTIRKIGRYKKWHGARKNLPRRRSWFLRSLSDTAHRESTANPVPGFAFQRPNAPLKCATRSHGLYNLYPRVLQFVRNRVRSRALTGVSNCKTLRVRCVFMRAVVLYIHVGWSQRSHAGLRNRVCSQRAAISGATTSERLQHVNNAILCPYSFLCVP